LLLAVSILNDDIDLVQTMIAQSSAFIIPVSYLHNLPILYRKVPTRILAKISNLFVSNNSPQLLTNVMSCMAEFFKYEPAQLSKHWAYVFNQFSEEMISSNVLDFITDDQDLEVISQFPGMTDFLWSFCTHHATYLSSIMIDLHFELVYLNYFVLYLYGKYNANLNSMFMGCDKKNWMSEMLYRAAAVSRILRGEISDIFMYDGVGTDTFMHNEFSSSLARTMAQDDIG